ncbi:MAG: hypothetical protein PHE17_18490 [Thiothrix sp.]|uniref:hypothetical protein n=1 Tax=Thiothrix sp. TaxID=1032 RepID=UPI0026282E99|nr:hypothetical protein [Thiothrix sp.]MDD5395012.1 hypothetical protein [Thiothrix sp.]
MNRPVLWLLPFLCLLLLVAGLARADLDTSSAFQQGAAMAAGGAAANAAVNGAGATGNVPGFTSSPSEAGLWGSGKTNLSGNGLGKQAGCTTSSTSGFGGQECNAINFLGGSRPQYPLEKNDALFNLSKGITKDNRGALAGLTGGNGTGGCTTVETTIPGIETVEHCEEWLEPKEERCPVGRVVKVDADANYQCDQTINAYETLSCDDAGVSCNVTGQELKCVPVSKTCIAGGGSCCMVNISCNGSSATISHYDCCGYSYSKTISSVNSFLSGISYNPAGAKITCNSSGSCSMSFENYYCNNPSVSIGHYANANSFNLNTSPIFSCTTGGGCEGLEARTK